MLVHIAPAKLEAKIRRSGIRPDETMFGGDAIGVYAFPVLPNYTLTHQWTREVLKWRRQPLIGVYFRVPDEEPVLFGHYSRPAMRLEAARAVRAIREAPDPRGFEMIVDGPIRSKAIHRIASLRGVVGWRHAPTAHGRRPCGCPACVARGEPGGKALRRRYESGEL